MKPAHKSGTGCVTEPPSPGRRRFLWNILAAGAALAAGCKPGTPPTEKRARLFRNRDFRIGNTAIVLEGCSPQSANFRIYPHGKSALSDSVSMLVPGSFSVPGTGSQYEIYVESVSCSGAQSADIIITSKPISGAVSASGAARDDIPIFASAFAVAAALVYSLFQRRPEQAQDESRGIPFSPKRNHLIPPSRN